jgi:hypothetical protein
MLFRAKKKKRSETTNSQTQNAEKKASPFHAPSNAHETKMRKWYISPTLGKRNSVRIHAQKNSNMIVTSRRRSTAVSRSCALFI